MKKLDKETWFKDKIVKSKLEQVWNEEGDYYQACFNEVIMVLKEHKKYYGQNIFEDSRFIGRRYKDMIGAHGIGKTAINIGLITEKAHHYKKKKKNEKITKDHLFGYITIAKTIINAFQKGKIENDENWLKKYFHLWLVIYVTDEEHHKDSIGRSNQKSNVNLNYHEKKRMKHYKNVSSLMIDENFKFRKVNEKYKKTVVQRNNRIDYG